MRINGVRKATEGRLTCCSESGGRGRRDTGEGGRGLEKR